MTPAQWLLKAEKEIKLARTLVGRAKFPISDFETSLERKLNFILFRADKRLDYFWEALYDRQEGKNQRKNKTCWMSGQPLNQVILDGNPDIDEARVCCFKCDATFDFCRMKLIEGTIGVRKFPKHREVRK